MAFEANWKFSDETKTPFEGFPKLDIDYERRLFR